MSTAVDVGTNYNAVLERVQKAAGERSVRLVAVSKTKPLELLQQAYDSGCRIFGENYAQELMEKAQAWSDKSDVTWHFIGKLQSNKCNKLVKMVPQLVVETLDSQKLADKLQTAVENAQETSTVKVYVQVNTSDEDSKNGVQPSECVTLCQYVVEHCTNLELQGVMTIGAIGDVNCFETLMQCKQEAESVLSRELEVSMGMSGDFEAAIGAGATNVRVGSTIFGARDYSNK